MTRTGRFGRGDILFSEGDAVEGVLHIGSGSVEILRRRDGVEIVLGTIHSGQVLGEMSVVEKRARRSATARAVTDGEVEFIGSAEFLDRISRSPENARTLIERLCHRLHDLEDRFVEDEQRLQLPAGRNRLGESLVVQNVMLAADSRGLRRQLPDPLRVDAVPFLVGRAALPGEQAPPRALNLELEDEVPLRLSRNHFAIIHHDGRYHVRDLRSTLGTLVNGRPIGEHFGSDLAPLVAGENEVVAGGKGSPFVFFITIVDEGNARR